MQEEIDALKAEVERLRAVANQLVGALRLDLPVSESTEMMLIHSLHRVREAQYMATQLQAALSGKGEEA